MNDKEQIAMLRRKVFRLTNLLELKMAGHAECDCIMCEEVKLAIKEPPKIIIGNLPEPDYEAGVYDGGPVAIEFDCYSAEKMRSYAANQVFKATFSLRDALILAEDVLSGLSEFSIKLDRKGRHPANTIEAIREALAATAPSAQDRGYAVRICPDLDRECGAYSATWCVNCPKWPRPSAQQNSERLALGYKTGLCISNPEGGKVVLHYTSKEAAEVAFEWISQAIDAAIQAKKS